MPKESLKEKEEVPKLPKESLKEKEEVPKTSTEDIRSLDVDPDIVFVFSEKSTDKTAPGKGPGEKIPKSKTADFKDLAEIPDWRKKLDTTWPIEIEVDGKTWASAEHFYQASKYKVNSYPLYQEFTKESGSDLSKDVEMAHLVGETGKYKGKQFKVAGLKKILADADFDKEEVLYKANKAKFTKHADLRDLLTKTNSAGLYHNLRGKEPEIQVALMKVRETIR